MPVTLPGPSDQVERIRLWQVPGSPLGVLAGEKRHARQALAFSGRGYASQGRIAVEWAAAQVTVTDPAQVRRIVALVDGLPLAPPGGDFSCPADSGATLVLTFRTQPGGPALAVAEPGLEGCEVVSFTIGGEPQLFLGAHRRPALELLQDGHVKDRSLCGEGAVK
jgi:hypothetical protein